MKQPAGYSGTPLAGKLGLPSGETVLVLGAPAHYATLLPAGTRLTWRAGTRVHFAHVFARTPAQLKRRFAALRPRLTDDGVLWVSWPKRTSTLAGPLDENLVREHGLLHRLVDVKVCAVDEDWSALKFVIRLRDRAG